MFAYVLHYGKLARVSVMSLEAYFYLPGCRSLKEKRGRLRGLKDRFGRATNVAVCELDSQDNHQQAQYRFVATAASATVVQKILADIERELQFAVDAQLLRVEREVLL